MTFMEMISVWNGTIVSVFGILLSASFCDIVWTLKKRFAMLGCIVTLLAFQGLCYFQMDYTGVRYMYPLIIHLPLAIALYIYTKQKMWSALTVFTAYLCCQIRRWIALLIVAIRHGDSAMQAEMELLVTLPLLLILIKFVAPSVREISHEPMVIQWQFGVIPLMYYVFDYITQIYTDIFVKGTPVVTEFMSFVCSCAYIVFLLRTSQEKKMRNQLEQIQDNLNLQITQAINEIEHLRNSQRQTNTYRHDLRHHLQYILSGIENSELEHVRTYIREIDSEIEASKVTAYCQNEATNLILSSFAGRVEACGISIKISAELPSAISVSETDLCVLLSNALENALHACQEVKAKGKPSAIEILLHEKKGKLFLQITNTCIEENVVLQKGIPVTNRKGHGIGIKSICALVERYRGMYTFKVDDGMFTLRVSL